MTVIPLKVAIFGTWCGKRMKHTVIPRCSTYFDFISGTRIKIVEFDLRFDCFDVGWPAGVVADVDDDVLLLLRGHVRLPRDVQAAFQRLDVLDDGRCGP